jgi:oligopeptidase B
LQFKDLRTGELSTDRITGIAAGMTWATDSATVYYTTVDEAWRPDTVWRHRLGHAGHDEQVFSEPDERFWVAVGRTRSNAYIVIAAGSAITSEVRVADASDPHAEFVPVLPRREGVEYSVDHVIVGGEDRFLILHNDGAPNFTLVDAPVDDPSAQRILIPARDDVRLEGVDAFAGHIVVHDRREALPRLQLWPVTGTGYGTPADITFDSELMACGLGGNPNWDAPRLRIGATSFLTPMRVYDIDLRASDAGGGERTLLREQPVLGGYRREDYVERRDWALAEDGTRIPISLMYRNDTQFPAPTVLYGYGAYESSEDPRFSIARLSLLDRGMVFAVAHVRGGGEMGRLWYERGKLLEKKNTFTDFIAAGRHLVDSGLTEPRNLVALGGSAGGLLMGAVANMAPELFAGILAQVPFVDPLTTILDPSLPLTVTEWDEWGNPLEDSDVYFYMKSYSPYENVEAKEYPAILAMTSLNDTRVFYVEPAKWVAALRHAKTDPHPVLLRTQMAAGHGGISGRYERWREAAFQYAWLLATADRDRFGKGVAES